MKWLMLALIFYSPLVYPDSILYPPIGSGGGGSGTVTSIMIGPYGSSPNGDGGSISNPTTNATLTLDPAGCGPNEPGGISVGTQCWAGNKTNEGTLTILDPTDTNGGMTLQDESPLTPNVLGVIGNDTTAGGATIGVWQSGSTLSAPASATILLSQSDVNLDTVNTAVLEITSGISVGSSASPAVITTSSGGTGTAPALIVGANNLSIGFIAFQATPSTGTIAIQDSISSPTVAVNWDTTDGWLQVNQQLNVTDNSTGTVEIAPTTISFVQSDNITTVGQIYWGDIKNDFVISNQVSGSVGLIPTITLTSTTDAEPNAIQFKTQGGTCSQNQAGVFSCTTPIAVTDALAWHNTLDAYSATGNHNLIGTNSSGATALKIEAHGTLVATAQVSGSTPTFLIADLISNPGSGTGSEFFGASSAPVGNDNAVFGEGALITSGNSNYTIVGQGVNAGTGFSYVNGTLVGQGTFSGNSNCTAVGQGALCNDGNGTNGQVSIGVNASTLYDDSVAVGPNASANIGGTALGGQANSNGGIAIGQLAEPPGAHWLQAGSTTNNITDVVFGNGGLVSGTTTVDWHLHGSLYSNPTGTANQAGSSIYLDSGPSSGNAVGGNIFFRTIIAGSSGTTVNSTYNQVLEIRASDAYTVGNGNMIDHKSGGSNSSEIFGTGGTYDNANFDTVFGDSNKTTDGTNTAIGYSNDMSASTGSGLSAGDNNVTGGAYTVMIGHNGIAGQVGHANADIINIGHANDVWDTDAIAIGRNIVAESGGTDSICIGAGSCAGACGNGTNSISMGVASITNGFNNSEVIGESAQAGGNGSVIVGANASTNGVNGISLGINATSGANGVAIGASAQSSGGISLGNTTKSTLSNNVFAAGSVTNPINDVYFGSGPYPSTGTLISSVVIHPGDIVNGSGTDLAGASITVASGRSSGAGAAGIIAFDVGGPGATSGTGANALFEAAQFDNLGVLHTEKGQDFNRHVVSGATSTYTILATDSIVGVTTTSGGSTLTLPSAASTNNGQNLIICDEGNSALTSNIVVNTVSSQNIHGFVLGVFINTTSATINVSGQCIRMYGANGSWQAY